MKKTLVALVLGLNIAGSGFISNSANAELTVQLGDSTKPLILNDQDFRTDREIIRDNFKDFKVNYETQLDSLLKKGVYVVEKNDNLFNIGVKNYGPGNEVMGIAMMDWTARDYKWDGNYLEGYINPGDKLIRKDVDIYRVEEGNTWPFIASVVGITEEQARETFHWIKNYTDKEMKETYPVPGGIYYKMSVGQKQFIYNTRTQEGKYLEEKPINQDGYYPRLKTEFIPAP